MYWVAEAGSAKATQAYSSSTGQAENIGRTGGSMAGGAATGTSRNVGIAYRQHLSSIGFIMCLTNICIFVTVQVV